MVRIVRDKPCDENKEKTEGEKVEGLASETGPG
jgi:hypothetical protein